MQLINFETYSVFFKQEDSTLSYTSRYQQLFLTDYIVKMNRVASVVFCQFNNDNYYNLYRISLVVFMQNIGTTNHFLGHAITYTNYRES